MNEMKFSARIYDAQSVVNESFLAAASLWY